MNSKLEFFQQTVPLRSTRGVQFHLYLQGEKATKWQMAHHQVDGYAEQTSVPYHRRRQEQNAGVLNSQLRRQIADFAIQKSARESLDLLLPFALYSAHNSIPEAKKSRHTPIQKLELKLASIWYSPISHQNDSSCFWSTTLSCENKRV